MPHTNRKIADSKECLQCGKLYYSKGVFTTHTEKKSYSSPCSTCNGTGKPSEPKGDGLEDVIRKHEAWSWLTGEEENYDEGSFLIKDLAKAIRTHYASIIREKVKKLKKDESKGNGKGCKCCAHYYGECSCEVDWTDYELYNQALTDLSNKLMKEVE